MPTASSKPMLGAASAALALALSAGFARGTPACAQTLPAPLVTFCAGGPALQSEINGNFLQTAAWFTQKAGKPSDNWFAYYDCIATSVTTVPNGTSQTLTIRAGGAQCGAGRSPILASCTLPNTGGVLEGQGVHYVNGAAEAFCSIRGGSGGTAQLDVTCCEFTP